MSKRGKHRGKSGYIRAGVYSLEEVLPHAFTPDKRKKLALEGIKHEDPEWAEATTKTFKGVVEGEVKDFNVHMESHRYQLFATKGVRCVKCGLEGKFMALERGQGKGNNPDRFHFNLYGILPDGSERMITKDHIIPKSKGGHNCLGNYQTMCQACNIEKGNKM